MTNLRFTSRFLLTAISSVIVLPAFAGQVAHRVVPHGGVPAPVHPSRIVHHPAAVRVHHLTRVVGTRVPSSHVHDVVIPRGVSAHGSNLTVVTPPAVVQGEPSHRWAISIAASTAILTLPSADGKVIKHIPAGTHVPDIIGEENGYYQYVRWTHKITYVAKSDVQLGSGTPIVDATHGGEPAQ